MSHSQSGVFTSTSTKTTQNSDGTTVVVTNNLTGEVKTTFTPSKPMSAEPKVAPKVAPKPVRPKVAPEAAASAEVSAAGSHYKTLGVNPDATAEEIKKAYHKLSLKCHPDRNKSEKAGAEFHQVKKAYDVLSDSDKRRLYDTGADTAGDEDPIITLLRQFFPDVQEVAQPPQVAQSTVKGCGCGKVSKGILINIKNPDCHTKICYGNCRFCDRTLNIKWIRCRSH